MTSNLVVERKKDQKRVEGLYDKAIKAPGGDDVGRCPPRPSEHQPR
jgi:hypothetical protein